MDVVRAVIGLATKPIVAARRVGDLAKIVADPTRVREVLKWEVRFGLTDKESSTTQPNSKTTTREALKTTWATITLPNRPLRPASMPKVMPAIDVVTAAQSE